MKRIKPNDKQGATASHDLLSNTMHTMHVGKAVSRTPSNASPSTHFNACLHAIETKPMHACMYARTHLLHAPALVLSSHTHLLEASCTVLSVLPSLAHPSIRPRSLRMQSCPWPGTHACTHLNEGRSTTQRRAALSSSQAKRRSHATLTLCPPACMHAAPARQAKRCFPSGHML